MRDEVSLASSRPLPSTPGPEGTGGFVHCELSGLLVISVSAWYGVGLPLSSYVFVLCVSSGLRAGYLSWRSGIAKLFPGVPPL